MSTFRDEKSPRDDVSIDVEQQQQPTQNKNPLWKRLFLPAIFFYIFANGLLGTDFKALSKLGCGHGGRVVPSALPSDGQIDMSKQPVGKLVPHKCWAAPPSAKNPEALECFRMSTPLEYDNPNEKRRADIALARYPAGGGKTPREKVLGTVFLNPGGPGGSGIDFMTRNSAKYNGSSSRFFDAIFESRYDIMSFDPRGVARTWPRADCWKDTLESYGDDQLMAGAGLPHSSSAAAAKAVAHDQLIDGLCQRTLGNETLRYVNTALMVKDMNLMRKAVGDEKLNYAGFSYGTVLGSYFADIFPEYVGHFWIDGVVDVPNYQQGLWSDNLSNFEDVLKGFFSTCVDAGPKHCALAKQIPDDIRNDKTKASSYLQDAFNAQIESLRTQPVAVPDAEFPSLATYIGYKGAFFSQMYSPYSWPTLANLSAASKDGNWVPFMNTFGPSKYEALPKGLFVSEQANTAIACGDATRDYEGWDVKDYKEFQDEIEKVSPFAGEIWSNGATCLGAWKTRGVDVWRGSFDSKPANPILFASNDYDPVTPLEAARKMQASFQGPNKLIRIEKGYGHCIIALVSRCSQKTIADWFVRDVLPEESERVCHLEAPPFQPQPSPVGASTLSTMSEEARLEELAYEAALGLSDIMSEWKHHGRM